MRKFLYCEAGFVEKDQWLPNSWVNVEVPTEDDNRYLIEELKVPQSFLSDIADVDERPRIEYEDNWMLTILRIPIYRHGDDVPFNTVPIGIITNNEIIISVCHFQTEMLSDFIVYTQRKQIKIRHKYDLILRMIYSSAVWYLKYLKQINHLSNLAEDALEKSVRNEDVIALMKLQKGLVYFNTSIRGNEMMLTKLQSIFHEPMYIDKDLLEDVETELRQAQSTVKIYTDILTGTMDTFASIISNNVSKIMKRMTAVSIVLMLPTLIASFYGMNVVNYWEEWDYGFMATILIAIFFSVGAFFLFRKIKWF